jgi:hypothetical protein
MKRMSGRGSARPGGVAYFIRCSGDQCHVIELQPGDRETAIADRLSLVDAEDLCVSKIEAPRKAAPAASPVGAEPAPAVPKLKKHGGPQLAFRF